MADHFSGPQACDDGAFIEVRFRDLVPDSHPIRFIDEFIESIDVSTFSSRYCVGSGQKGRAPKDIRLMLKVILYAVYVRLYSARRIDYASAHYADFWFVTHGMRISHDKISDFIVMHGEEIHSVFLETIGLASRNDLLDFSALYEDGFQIKANASIKRSYQLDGLDKKEQKLSDNLAIVLAKLQQPEEDESAKTERQKVQDGLSKIASLREELQKRIAQRTEGKAPWKAKRATKNLRINMTDPDAEIMKQKDGSHAVSYLRETAVDSRADIIIGSEISGHYNEIQLSLPLAKQANQNCEDAGCSKTYTTIVADSGFISMENCEAFEQAQLVLIGPTQALEHQNREPSPDRITFSYNESDNMVTCSEGQNLYCQYPSSEKGAFSRFSNQQACKQCARVRDCTNSIRGYRTVKLNSHYRVQQRTLKRYLSKEGQLLYGKRSHSGETYQGDLKNNGRFIRFLRRGIKKAKVDAQLQDIVWNLRRIINLKGPGIIWGT